MERHFPPSYAIGYHFPDYIFLLILIERQLFDIYLLSCVILPLCFSNNSEDSEPIPPPPVAWNQVSGLQPFLETSLKKILQEISQTETWQTLQPLTTTCVIFLGVYYSAYSQQVRPENAGCLLISPASACVLPLKTWTYRQYWKRQILRHLAEQWFCLPQLISRLHDIQGHISLLTLYVSSAKYLSSFFVLSSFVIRVSIKVCGSAVIVLICHRDPKHEANTT